VENRILLCMIILLVLMLPYLLMVFIALLVLRLAHGPESDDFLLEVRGCGIPTGKKWSERLGEAKHEA
jgi:hypothetical protein